MAVRFIIKKPGEAEAILRTWEVALNQASNKLDLAHQRLKDNRRFFEEAEAAVHSAEHDFDAVSDWLRLHDFVVDVVKDKPAHPVGSGR